MKVLVTSINFAPDHSGIALYSTDLPVFLEERGHQVTMVTGFPYYPRWMKSPGDVGAVFRGETYRGIDVRRGYLYVPRTVSTASRILHELTFVFFAAVNCFRVRRNDAVIVISPPLLLGVVGIALRRLSKAKLVFHIQDMQPDAAVSLGMLRSGLLVRLLLMVERWIYREADLVVAITEGMRKRLLEKRVPESKVALCPNWIDVKSAASAGTRGAFLRMHPNAAGKMIVAYAGNIGVKQGVDVLVKVAAALQADPRFFFFIIGSGADQPRLERLAEASGLSNLRFLAFMPQEQYFDMLEDIDVSFVAQRAATGEVFFPSKILGIMAKGVPLLISADVDSELAQSVERFDCGLVASAGDVERLVEHLLVLVEDRARYERLSANGRAAVWQFDRNVVLQELERRVMALTLQGRTSGEPHAAEREQIG